MIRDQAETLRLVVNEELSGYERARDSGHYCRVVVITGGKGGVGKTNIAANLSLALCEAGAKVLLMDADLGLANVDVLLGLNPDHTLEHVIHRQVCLRDILIDGPLGLKVLPGGTGIPDLANLQSLDIVRLLGELRSLEREFDILVIDTAAGITQQVTKFALAADDVVVVATPEPPAMLDAYGMMKSLVNSNLRGQLHLLVNMVSKQGEANQTYKALNAVAARYLGISLSLLGSLPRDEAIVAAIKQQKAFFIERPNSPAARQLRNMAGYFLAGLDVTPAKESAGFFTRLLESIR